MADSVCHVLCASETNSSPPWDMCVRGDRRQRRRGKKSGWSALASSRGGETLIAWTAHPPPPPAFPADGIYGVVVCAGGSIALAVGPDQIPVGEKSRLPRRPPLGLQHKRSNGAHPGHSGARGGGSLAAPNARHPNGRWAIADKEAEEQESR